MADRPDFATFEEFWPFYVGEHAKKTTRTLHFIGTTAAMTCVAAALLGHRRYLLLAPIVGYAPAWVGHFFVENNRPATFKHPIWSLRGDLIMWAKTVMGTMDAEAERVAAERRPQPQKAPEGRASTERDQTLN